MKNLFFTRKSHHNNRSVVENIDKTRALQFSQSGYKKLVKKDYFEAIDDYSMAISLGDDDAMGYLFRGIARMEVGQTEEAFLDMVKAIEGGAAVAQDVLMRYMGL